MVEAVTFLERTLVRGLIEEIEDLATPSNYEETESEGPDGYLKNMSGISRLTYQTSQGPQELILTRRLAQDINPDTGEKEIVTEMVRD